MKSGLARISAAPYSRYRYRYSSEDDPGRGHNRVRAVAFPNLPRFASRPPSSRPMAPVAVVAASLRVTSTAALGAPRRSPGCSCSTRRIAAARANPSSPRVATQWSRPASFARLSAPAGAPRAPRASTVVRAHHAEAAIAAGMTALEFTPVHAICGGLILGIATIAKLMLTGRILGVSGSFKRPTEGDFFSWDFAFVGGLLAAGLACTLVASGPIPPEPMVSVGRAVASGALVGAGAAMGNGCTSGHGICGNALLSPRSMMYTGVFMVVGFLSATLFDTNAALGVAPSSAIAHLSVPSAATLSAWAAFAAFAVAAFAALGFLASNVAGAPAGAKATAEDEESLVGAAGTPAAKLTSRQRLVNVLADALVGFVFGVGLVVSGMVHPVKVSGFLSAMAPSWDPSLALVMGGALALCAPGFYLVQKLQRAPTCAAGFQIPQNKNVDAKLVTGGVLFGAGWGLGGICPGPAIVSMAMVPSPALAAWVASMVVGMYVNKRVLSKVKTFA